MTSVELSASRDQWKGNYVPRYVPGHEVRRYNRQQMTNGRANIYLAMKSVDPAARRSAGSNEVTDTYLAINSVDLSASREE